MRLMKNGLLLSVAGVFAAFSGAAAADSVSATANAKVIVPITITETQQLNFGSLAAGTGGTVVMTTAGARSSTGTVVLSSMDVGTEATFDVAGEPNYTYAITLPSTDQTLTSGANTMTVNTFESNPSGTGTLDGTGAQTISVGATLNVGSGQAAGTYTGSYTVSVEYN